MYKRQSLYTLSVVLCLILRGASQNGDTGYVYMIFLLDVFLTALLTEGFFFSLIISIFAVLSVDYIFTPPYWNVSFTLSGFPLTFLVTMTISVVTGIVTSRAKQMDEVRREAELERMHGNLLRAVSHDIRTPLTGIVGATNVLLEQENTLTPEPVSYTHLVRPPNRGSRCRRRRHTTAPVSSSPAAATNTHTTSRNSPRTSAKWPAPSAEKGSTPAEKSGLRPMQ